ncbi:heavy metal translocating P-type ATPase [Zavarzinia sp. CC-PAN008]|uniref:heavy metal translocating P-type ATPase n=1 Tax=Zavarzinia sp. CC-PAN008 TaxID=3243332 RepID=UPI003F744D23
MVATSLNRDPLRTRLHVTGMDCPSCAAKIDAALGRLDHVREVGVSVPAGTVTLVHDAGLDLGRALAQLAALGFPATAPVAQADGQAPHGHGHSHSHSHSHDHGAEAGDWWRGPKVLLTAACGLALAAAYGLGLLVPALGSYAFLAALGVGLVPVARRAFVAARLGTPFSIEMLMTIAAIGAVIIGATEEAAAVVFLFLVGEVLEGVAAGRARASIRALADLVPRTALVEQPDGGTREIAAADLAVGAVILVRPGDRLGADGTIVSGTSDVNEAPVTGESVPRSKVAGDTVYAGTINGAGVLRVAVTATAGDNTIARVVRLVEEAQAARAPTMRWIDRFSRIYTPAVVVLALLVAVLPPLLAGGDWAEWVYKALAVLLIGCPCALVISTPAAIAAGLSAGARRGLLIKGGAVLERLGGITLVAFDKTGTLTEGRPQVVEVRAWGAETGQVLALAAAVEAGSSHPLAIAILERAERDGIAVHPAAQGAAQPGRGVSGLVDGRRIALLSVRAAADALDSAQAADVAALNHAGHTVSVLLADGVAMGAIALRDTPRADARAGLQAVAQAGIGRVMLTGDQHAVGQAIGRDLGLAVQAELLPQDKLDAVRALEAQGHRVAVVGDGINDAPALAAAHVGIAMGGGTDVALETADAASLHGRVGDVARMVALSRAVMANIRQNITIAVGLKVVFLATTVAGITGLWPAILADTGATVLVTLNALRLLRRD